MKDWVTLFSRWNRKRLRRRHERRGATAALAPTHAAARSAYLNWVAQYDTVTPELRAGMEERFKAMHFKPLISIIVPVYNPQPAHLRAAIESIEEQIYDRWELCLANDASTDARVRDYLNECVHRNPKIRVVHRVVNGHISAASNSALELATGEFVALFDQDDVLPPHALLFAAEAINRQPDVGLIYSDEDKIDESGERIGAHFKPAWNVDLFRSINMVSHLGVYRHSLVKSVGGFRKGFEGSQDYDLALRCIERLKPSQIVHLPFVLYHWRIHAQSTAMQADAKPYAIEAGRRAIQEHLERLKIDATVRSVGFGYRVRYALPDPRPKVSMIVPTRDMVGLLKQCIDTVVERTIYSNYEIIIVDNGSIEDATLDYFKSLEGQRNVRILRDPRPFNYSQLNNLAVKESDADFICLLNNDIEPMNPDWLHELMSFAALPDVGAVGARLWYPDRTLQHGGVVLGLGGVASHSHTRLGVNSRGYFGRAELSQSYSAVTGACLLLRRSLYLEVGGLDEVNLAVAYNDVDLCLKVGRLGYRNVWTPYAQLIHHESASRGRDDNPVKRDRFNAEQDFMQRKWGDLLRDDPAYNPNLTLYADDFGLAFPPRVSLRGALGLVETKRDGAVDLHRSSRAADLT